MDRASRGDIARERQNNGGNRRAGGALPLLEDRNRHTLLTTTPKRQAWRKFAVTRTRRVVEPWLSNDTLHAAVFTGFLRRSTHCPPARVSWASNCQLVPLSLLCSTVSVTTSPEG